MAPAQTVKKVSLTGSSHSERLGTPILRANHTTYGIFRPLLGSPSCLAFGTRPPAKTRFWSGNAEQIGDPPQQRMGYVVGSRVPAGRGIERD